MTDRQADDVASNAGDVPRKKPEFETRPERVCYCLGWNREAVLAGIRRYQLTSVEQIRGRLLVGSRCGGCVSTLRQLLLETETARTLAGVGPLPK
jgi:bacterioferritin-associated ferredoxin